MAESIIYTRIITHNSPKLIKDLILLKDREENRKLIIASVTFHRIKTKEGLNMLFCKMVHKMSNNSKQKMTVWRGPDIK
jgi:hypothetical protein